MNQSILFPDVQEYQALHQRVVFPAQQAGALIECHVTLHWLATQTEGPLTNQAEVLEQFSRLRFDIEEIAESLIEEERFDAEGHIVIDR